MEWLLELDRQVFREIHEGLRGPILGALMWAFSYSGLAQVQAIAALLLLVKKETKFYTFPLLMTILVAGLPVAQGIKRLMPRERPSNLMFAQPEEAWLANSFPSGHTTTAFAFATMLFLMTRGSRNAWIGKVAIAWAALVGISRVYRGVHWPTDVMAGACAGVFAACLVYLLLRRLGKQLHLDQPEATISGQEAER